jgi:2,3-bisphosphoglycerate-dependent phosphoglycerate mutase
MSSDPVTRIVLARHGEAAYPSSPGDDAGGGVLTELGREQARGLGSGLRDEGVTAVVSSELSRATQTAEIAADLLGLEPSVRTGLHEYEQGDEPYDLRAIGTALLAWLAGDLEPRLLGGENGDEIVRRVMPVLGDLVVRHPGGTVLVVVHGGVIIATLGSIAPGRTGLPSEGNPSNLETDLPGGVRFVLERRADGWRLAPSSPES